MYKILLPNFEGPFDLLLYFIKKEEINIYDIPIARILEEFLNYIKLMQSLDLEITGEFILMAAQLMNIKSQMLLPTKITNGSGEIEDPRNELIHQLLEYKKFKAVGKQMDSLYQNHHFILYRSLFDVDAQLVESLNLQNLSVMSLINALQKALNKAKMNPITHDIAMEQFNIETTEKELIELLEMKKRIKFSKLIKNKSKKKIIMFFLTILELVKNRKLYIRQIDNFEDITIGLIPTLN